MKFCTKCGHELIDEAVVCTNCGCFVNQSSQVHISESTAPPTEARKEKSSVLLCIFNFIFSITAAVAVFFLIWSLGWGGVDTSISFPNYSISIYAWFYPNGLLVLIGVLASIVSCGFGIISFILSLAQKEKIDKVLTSIARMIIGILLVVLSICIGG